MPNQYVVREDLKKSLPGSYYQVLVALSYILKGLNQNKKFNIMLEKANVGAFDDIVIEYFDNTRKKITEKLFLQLKHANKDEEILKESDLINKSGKFEIFKYFDDWYLFIKNQNDASSVRCAYYTNRDLDESLKKSKSFMQVGDSYQFSTDFFNGGKNSLHERMVRMIKKNSVMYKQDLVAKATTQTLAKNPTYKAAEEYYKKGKPLDKKKPAVEVNDFLKNYYVMMVGKQHVDNLEKEVNQLVSAYFPQQADAEAIFHALIVETWHWFRVMGSADIWTEAFIEGKLAEFEARFTKMPQEIGRMVSELSQPLKILKSKIAREDALNQIDQAIKGKDNVVVFEGEAGHGKTVLITEYLLNRTSLNPGNYLYYFSPDEFFNNYKELSNIEKLSLFIVDGITNDSEQLQQAIKCCKEKSKRLILFSRASINGIPSSFISILSKAEIKDYLKKEGKLDYLISVGHKNFPLKNIVELGTGGLFSQIQFPKNLQALCEIASPANQISTVLDLASPYIINPQANFKPVHLYAKQILPLYTLNEILKLDDFKGHKYASYDSAESLANFKMAHPGSDKYGWLDIATISLPCNENINEDISVNIMSLLTDKLSDSNKQSFQKEEFHLLLTDINDNLQHYADLLKDLVEIPQVVIFSSQTLSVEPNFILKNQNQKYYFEYQTKQLRRLPPGSSTIKQPTAKSIQQTLEKNLAKESAVIVAEAGAGKSTTLKILSNEYAQSPSLIWGNHYHHLVLVSLNRLPNLKLNTLLDVCKYCLDIKNNVINHAIAEDLTEGRVLFLLDAWDELNSIERHKLTSLLSLFENYQHIVTTTRPTDRHNLFFHPVGVYELQRFNKDQVSECFTSFFQSKDRPEIAKQFINNAVLFLQRPENAKALEIIGLPLQCYLLCEAWRPHFEAACQGNEISLPWKSSSALSRVQLYQLFIVSRLRKCLSDQQIFIKEGTLQSPEEICALSAKYLEALQKAAYSQLVRGKPLQLGNDWFSKQIARLGLIDKDEFTHKTYAEYFLALYIVNLLISNPKEADELIAEYRYQSHYRLVFEFMAGIVSYDDPIIPNASKYLSVFWQALLQKPRDCIGLANTALIMNCYVHSNEQALQTIFEKKAMLSIQEAIAEKYGNINIQASNLEYLPPSLSKKVFANNNFVNFKEPYNPNKYGPFAKNISRLPVTKYSISEKYKALSWFLRTMTNNSSYKVKEACATKISQLGIKTSETLPKLLQLLNVNEKDDRSRAHERIVDVLISLNCELNKFEITPTVFNKILKYLASKVLTKNEIQWLARQNYLSSRLRQLVSSFENASFKTQQALISNLAIWHKGKFLDIIREFSEQKNKWGSLHYCFNSALVQAKRIEVQDYFASIASISQSNVDAFDIVKGLIKPTRNILKEHAVAENDKALWVDKLYEIVLRAVKMHEERDRVAKLIIELVNLKLDAYRMETLLNKLFSPGNDENYWDANAVSPCLPHLMSYFDKAFSQYLVYKTTSSSIIYDLPLLLYPELVDTLPNNEARKLMVKTCLDIFNIYSSNRYKYGDKLDMNSVKNPVYYVKSFSPDIALPSILADFNDNHRNFLQNYLQLNHYALTIHDNSIYVYTRSGIQSFKINAEQKLQLLKIQNSALLLTQDIKSKIPPRSPSPEIFSFEYPGVLFTNKRKRSNSYIADLDTNEPPNKAAKLTSGNGS